MNNIIIETESDQIEAKVLGQRVSVPESYDPNILVAIPRSTNRIPYGIDDSDFNGYDYWNAYECTYLLETGSPIYLGVRIKYPSSSEFIVESKSLKLYFNSFNNYKIKGSIYSSKNQFLRIVEEDLKLLLNTVVKVNILDKEFIYPYDEFISIDSFINRSQIHITQYHEDANILEYGDMKEFSIYIEGLMSNCQVTGAPDHATLLIKFNGKKGVNLTSLFKYIVSHRKENRFHEATLETIFKHIKDKYNPDSLTMLALYTRRGGISISPFRTTESDYQWNDYRSYFD